ncbi:hypothetical protein BH09VER1_BH09VER1_26560 [soil metagenome]
MDIGGSLDLQTAAKRAAMGLGWKIASEAPRQIVARVGISLLSHGEKVTISFSGERQMSVTSKCMWPIQVWDHGKNRQNVAQFLETIQRHV